MNYGEIWCEDITIQIHKSHVKVEKYIKKPIKLWCWNMTVSETSFQDLKNNWLNCQDSVSILAPGAAKKIDREYFQFWRHRVQKCAKKTCAGWEISSMHWQIILIWRWEIDFPIKHLSKMFSRFTGHRHFLVCLFQICEGEILRWNMKSWKESRCVTCCYYL